MHGFLIIGNNSKAKKIKVDELSRSLNAKVIPYKLEKIEDIRNLTNIVKLSLSEKTIFLIENIEQTTPETLNAFLKTLEEPQENLYFILTASSIKKVLPTIVSRCQVMNLGIEDIIEKDFEESKKFTGMTMGEKLSYVDKIKDREKAISFTEELIFYYHSLIHSDKSSYKNLLMNINISTQTLKNLKSNGNINLQLTHLVSNLV